MGDLRGDIEVTESLSGNITPKGNLQGGITGRGALSGGISATGNLRGNIASTGSLQGNIRNGGEKLEGKISKPENYYSNDYEELINKPAINNVKLIGDKPLGDFDIQETNTYASNTDIDSLFRGI